MSRMRNQFAVLRRTLMAIIKVIDQSLMQVVSDRATLSPAIQLDHE